MKNIKTGTVKVVLL